MARKNFKQENKTAAPKKPEIPEYPFSKLQQRMMMGIVFVFAVILYANTFNHQYALDDKMAVFKNQFVMKGTDGISEIMKTDFFAGFFGKETNMVEGGRYRPLSLVTFAIEYEMYGLSPRRSHVINTLLYGFLCMMMFMALSKLLVRFPYKKWYLSLPFITTLLFVANPLHTEAVANIKGRDEIFSLGFSLLTTLMVFRYLEVKKPFYLILTFAAFFLAMLSKENAAAFVVIIPVALYLFKEYDLKKIIISLLPIIAAFAAYFLIREGIFEKSKDILTKPELMNDNFLEMSGPQKSATIFFTLGMYLKLLVFPHPLTYDYYPYHIPIMEWSNPWVLISFIAFAAIFVLSAYYLFSILFAYIKALFSNDKTKKPSGRGLASHQTILIFSLLIFVITLLPTSNLFFPIGAFMNERFVFTGLLGFCLIIAYAVIYKLPGIIKKPETHFSVSIVIFALLIGVWSYKTIDRNKAWKDNLTLFSTDIETCPNSAKGNSSLGGEYLDMAGKEGVDSLQRREYIQKALPYFYKAVEIHPTYIEPLIRIGKSYYDLDQNLDSLFHYFILVLAIDPANQDVHGNLQGYFAGFQDPDMKKITVPVTDIKKAAADIYYNLGVTFGKFKQDPKTAIKYFKKSLEYNNKDFQTHKFLGVVYGMAGEVQNSIDILKKAIEINPNDAQVYLNMSISYQNLGDIQNAQAYYAKAVSLNPSLNQQPK